MQSTGKNRRVIGIVTEFNPFHKGHQYLIQACREWFGADAVILCVMSGDFVQRGEPAVLSKYARAEAACRCGADLVAELPPHGSLASAEGFAESAVSMLLGLGMDTLCFGSETEDTAALQALAEFLCTEESRKAVKDRLKQHPDCSYAEARQQVAEEKLGSIAQYLAKPNCILGVEYVKALQQAGDRGKQTELFAVARIGVEHDAQTAEESPYKSASELRALLRQGKSIARWVPEEAEYVYQREIAAGRGPVSTDRLETVAMAQLRLLPAETFRHSEDGADGLGNRIAAAAASEGCLEELFQKAKTRRYALSRIRRLCWRLVLGLESGAAENRERKKKNCSPGFARVLAISETGREYLRKRPEGIPVLTKTAQVKKLDPECRQLFDRTVRTHDIYVLAYDNKQARCGGEDWRRGPFRRWTEEQ